MNNLKPFFKRIWLDPVWSKVIAFIITTLIVYLGNQLSHNNKLTIILSMIVLFLWIIFFYFYNKIHGITWINTDRFLSAALSGHQIDRINNFILIGNNKSTNPIIEITGFLRSNITNEKYPIYLNAEGTLVFPEQTNGIPGQMLFEIVVPLIKNFDGNLNNGIDKSTFLENFIDCSILLKIEGIDYSFHFSKKKILQQLSMFEAGENIKKRISLK